MKLLVLVLLIFFNGALFGYLESWVPEGQEAVTWWETDDFRAMRLGEAAAGLEEMDCEALAFGMMESRFDLTGRKLPEYLSLHLAGLGQSRLSGLSRVYHTIFDDLSCFPIPQPASSSVPDIRYENGWMEERTFGGERGHEGCDLMGDEMPGGFYPVLSMTDGVVEQVGWLPLGGYRIGIRAPAGAYFYYAHLSEYAREFQAGDRVSAGELLGYMGDTGYGEEGTTGQFPVHLHLGIYIKTEHYEELSINPYWILRYMEKKRSRFFPLYFSGDFGMIEGNVKNAG